MNFNDVGVAVPEILLPREGVDITKWAVVACDQYTSEPDYWQEAERIVAQAPSTLKLILPEAYLDAPDETARIASVKATMQEYASNNLLASHKGFVLTRREVDGHVRDGLMLALDLERYDYTAGSTSLIRATEGTIVERIPPRLRIREGALLELPHILILIDDPLLSVVEPLAAKLASYKKLYDAELMQGGGHVSGYMVDPADHEGIFTGLSALYTAGGENPLLFAVGDGNHSLATAKASWEKLKQTPGTGPDHPARYALVEVVNVHSPGIIFEPIHRVLFGVNVPAALSELHSLLQEQNGACTRAEAGAQESGAILPFMSAAGDGCFCVPEPKAQLPTGTLQSALDAFLAVHPEANVDYIHGEGTVRRLCEPKQNIGFLLPPMDKGALFRAVSRDGALPRKTFSMGEAHEKRFYLEARRILP